MHFVRDAQEQSAIVVKTDHFKTVDHCGALKGYGQVYDRHCAT